MQRKRAQGLELGTADLVNVLYRDTEGHSRFEEVWCFLEVYGVR